MKFLPFAIRYGTAAKVVLSDTSASIVALSVAAFNDALAEVNAHPTTYGLGAGAVLPALPAVPTGALGIAYQSHAELGKSEVLQNSRVSTGRTLPDGALDALLDPTNLAAIVAANEALKPLITTGPLTKTVASGATTFVVVSSGAGLTYQWQKSTDTGVTWTNITNAGVYTTATTATLHISDVAGLTLTQYRCVVTNNSAVRTSSSAILTVA